MNHLLIQPVSTDQENAQTNPQYTGIVKHASGLDPFLNEEEFLNAWERVGGTPQHLHLISKRDICIGDYITDTRRVYPKVDMLLDGYIGLYKIEASTDESLGLPSIPNIFIRALLKYPKNMKEQILSIKFDEGGVVVNDRNEVIFVAICDNKAIQEASQKFAEESTKDIQDGVFKFATQLAIQSAFIAGADFRDKFYKP